MGARFSRVNPAKTRTHGIQIDLTPDSHRGLGELARKTCETKTGIIRRLLEAEMRAHGILPPLLTPEDFQEGEDKFLYPWTKIGAGHLPPNKMVWFSRNPELWCTWANLFRDMERITGENLATICERYGVSKIYAQRQFARFDRWRRGNDVYPHLDPIKALKRISERKRPKRRA